MHERSLVRALVRQVEQLAAEYAVSRVRSVRVRVGELSGVEPELLTSAYGEQTAGTSLQGSTLVLECVPLHAKCDNCGQLFRIERFDFRCRQCGSPKLSLRGGEELLLESVMIED